MKYLSLLLSLFVFILISCTSKKQLASYGLSTENEAYIPARISVLKCKTLTQELKFLSKTNVSNDIQNTLCLKFDQFVISGFQNQPYMNGYTPSVVIKLLTKNNKIALMNTIDQIWKSEDKCKKCKNLPSFYKIYLSQNPKWISWLNTFSISVRNSDAVLIPFLLYANENKENQRGLLVSQNSSKIALFLIDTNNGELIWSGFRQAKIANQTLKEGKSTDFLPFPNWKLIGKRLFTSPLWENFPGRQTF